MYSPNDLLAEVRKLYTDGQFQEASSLMPEQLLNELGDANLWAEKSFSLFHLDKFPESAVAFRKAIQHSYIYPVHLGSANKNASEGELITLIQKIVSARKDEIDLIKIGIGLSEKEFLYNLGNKFLEEANYLRAAELYEQALTIDPLHEGALYNLGILNFTLKKYKDALDNYDRLLKVTKDTLLLASVHYNIALIHFESEDYDSAVIHYLESTKLDPQAYRYFNLGLTYHKQKRYRKAIDSYLMALSDDPSQPRALYNLAFAYFDEKDYENSRDTFIKLISLGEDRSDYFISNAFAKLGEIYKIQDNNRYQEISELVNQIKDLLLFTEEEVTHYTSLSVTSNLLLGKKINEKDWQEKDDYLRLSEGIFLNDPSEGAVLYGYLNHVFESSNGNNFDPFIKKPFIGSFVPKSKANDLTLWRMYGKDNMEEAKGCSITINKIRLLEAISANLKKTSDAKNTQNVDLSNFPRGQQSTLDNDENFRFYRVAYLASSSNEFIIPGFDIVHQDYKRLNELMKLLKSKYDGYQNSQTSNGQSIKQLLNSIAYLFKSEEFLYEHEIRLVVESTGFTKIVDRRFDPPRVYLQLAKLNPLVEKLTLGPKVEKAKEHAAAFYYYLANEKIFPDINISLIPFK